MSYSGSHRYSSRTTVLLLYASMSLSYSIYTGQSWFTLRSCLAHNRLFPQAVLVRLNKQLDEDARTAISDAERYLRETPVPSRRSGTSSSHRDAAYPVASSSNRRSATSNRAIQSRPNPNDTLDEKMGEKISRNIENDDYDMVGRRHVDSSAWRTGVDGWGGHENSQSEGDRGVPGVAGTSSKGSPPLKVPERLTEAVRATGERKSGGRAGEVSARSDMLSLVSNKGHWVRNKSCTNACAWCMFPPFRLFRQKSSPRK